MKLLLLLFGSFFSFVAAAQETIDIGTKYHLYSKMLHEERTVSISLPPSYYNKKYAPAHYPVLYLLDGEMAFDYYAAIVRFLSKGVYAHIPEMIVVGINNTDRTRDLTPTRTSIKSPDDSTKILFANSGGGEAFIRFIGSELMPWVDSSFRTANYKIFAGHSFGGLAATQVLLHHTSLFNAYLIHDPSLWWDNQILVAQAGKVFSGKNFYKTRVYLSQANNNEKGAFDEHFESIKKFKQQYDTAQNKTVAFRYEFYEHEDHGTLPLPAAYNGLQFIFSGYQADFKLISKDKELLVNSYKKFSEQMNFTFRPSEEMLQFIIRYFKENNKPDEAEAVTAQYRYFYPGI
ncbi:MAG: alpha/beta hydrolase-fold protein [Niabella sp.]